MNADVQNKDYLVEKNHCRWFLIWQIGYLICLANFSIKLHCSECEIGKHKEKSMYIFNFVLRKALCEPEAGDYCSENAKTIKTFPFKLLFLCILQRVITFLWRSMVF